MYQKNENGVIVLKINNFAVYIAFSIIIYGCGGGGSDSDTGSHALKLPDAPTLIEVKSEENRDVKLTWTPVNGVEYYNVYYSTDPQIDIRHYSVYANNGFARKIKSPFIIKDLPIAPVYYFVITSIEDDLESSASKTVAVINRYEVVGEEKDIIRDKFAGLEWQRCSLGQVWNKSKNTCDGVAGRYNTKFAFSYDGSSAGKWRLPYMAELRSLTYCVEDYKITFIGLTDKNYCPSSVESGVSSEMFPNTALSGVPYHSATQYMGRDGVYYMVNLKNGGSSGAGCGRYCEDTSVHVRLVRYYSE